MTIPLNHYEPATVTQTSPLRVKRDLAQSDEPALRLTGYTPTLGDRVSVTRQGTQSLVVGTFA
jgi:hypothetical protein